jgi:membrane protease YdiL (CAAX protease family)
MSNQAFKRPLIKQGWLRVILFGIGALLIGALFSLPVAIFIIRKAQQTDSSRTIQQLLQGEWLWLLVILECLVSLISVWIFRVFVDRKSLASLGLGLSGYETEAATGLFMAPALLGISSLLMLLSGHLVWTDISWNLQSLTISLGLMMLIAFSEELVFRGYILGNLLDSFKNKWIALGISALLFAIFHAGNPGMNTIAFVNLFLAGMLLGINYIFTRNLWFSFLFHLSWNFFQGPLLGFNVSGLHLPSLLQLETKGDPVLTGGDFGLEGSVLNTAISLIALMVLAWAFERKYGTTNLQLQFRQSRNH